jgi:hypothetical protein
MNNDFLSTSECKLTLFLLSTYELQPICGFTCHPPLVVLNFFMSYLRLSNDHKRIPNGCQIRGDQFTGFPILLDELLLPA